MTEKRVWFVTGAGRGMGVDIAKAATLNSTQMHWNQQLASAWSASLVSAWACSSNDFADG